MKCYYVYGTKRTAEFMSEDKLYDCLACARDVAAFIHEYFDGVQPVEVHHCEGTPTEQCHNKEHLEKKNAS